MLKGDLFPERLYTEMDRLVPHLLAEACVPGLAVAVVQGGQTVWTAQFGVMNIEANKPVSAETIFDMASLSKPVFAYGVFIACERGILALDTPLRVYLPHSYLPDIPAVDRITARMVLDHTTGLPNWRRKGHPLTLNRTPGEQFGYSGEGFVYLQHVLEHLTGQPLAQYMWQVVLEPLGMSHSGFAGGDEHRHLFATGYTRDGTPQLRGGLEKANAAWSLTATTRDYARFLIEMMPGVIADAGRKRRVAEMLMPRVRVTSNLAWGIGWGLQETPDGPAFWHWGDSPGFKNFTVGYPEEGVGGVVFTNGDNGIEVCKRVVSTILGDEQPAFAMLENWEEYKYTA